MDRSVDPCTNFYQYACGGWIKKNPIPADQARWEVYGKMQHENELFLWGILADSAKPVAGRSAEQQKIGDYFHSCMDEASVEKEDVEPLRPGLEAIAQVKSIRELADLVASEHLNGTSTLFGFGSNQDFEDSSRVIGFATAGGLSLPDRDYYVKDEANMREIREKYVAHVARIFELLGDDAKTAAAEAETVLAMETALAKASLTQVEKRDPYKLFHKMTLPQFQAMTPSFRWDRYLAAAGAPSIATTNVTEPAFYKELERELASRSLVHWKTYLRWHLVHSKAPYLSSRFVNENFAFYGRTLRGIEELPPRWKRCVQYVDRDLGEALGKVFVEKTLGPAVKARALEMTKNIEKSMEDEIKSLPWMGDQTKQQALLKLHSVVNKIGYPEKWRDYSSITIVRGDFLGNVNRAARFETRRDLAKIGKPVDRTEWEMTPPTVDAYYSPQMNDINFPAGVLQPPLFDFKMDDAPNYGNTGSTIGHELTHGFDDEGRQFDAMGNLRDWWTKKDAEEFEKRASCVSAQYANYTVVDDVKINSKLTLGEDVADLGGTLLAYIAWKSETRSQQLKEIDGLTPDQRFFVGMAQWACGSERDESKRVNAVTNPHSPPEYRVNGVVVNMPEFAQAFSCTLGQPMVKEKDKVCRIW
ncbi:MAG TPA: M13 family metallopeptidase [Bryobacteraceae bacterium]|nr:M13 family metallopeptidase [Bryobacteraceae bacterium]